MGLFDFIFKNRGDYVKEEHERILRDCNQALALNDKNPDLWNTKCLVLIQLGSHKEAIEAGKIAVQLAPNDPEFWDTLRSAYSIDGNQQKVDECQKNASELIQQKKEAEKQRIKQEDSRKECWRCRVHASEIIQCGPCGRYFCPDCWRDHQWVHGKSPSIGISYQTGGTYSGFDGTEKMK